MTYLCNTSAKSCCISKKPVFYKEMNISRKFLLNYDLKKEEKIKLPEIGLKQFNNFLEIEKLKIIVIK